MTNIVDFLKPIESYRYPLADGPMNAPSANVDVHNPDISPYVSIVSGNPSFLFFKINDTIKYTLFIKLDYRGANLLHCCS